MIHFLLLDEFYPFLGEYYYKEDNERSIYILISKELKFLDLKTLETKDIFMYHDVELYCLWCPRSDYINMIQLFGDDGSNNCNFKDGSNNK